MEQKRRHNIRKTHEKEPAIPTYKRSLNFLANQKNDP